MLYIGNHTSSSRGYLAMGKQMLANGGNTFAFFTRNPRGGKAKEIDFQESLVKAFYLYMGFLAMNGFTPCGLFSLFFKKQRLNLWRQTTNY